LKIKTQLFIGTVIIIFVSVSVTTMVLMKDALSVISNESSDKGKLLAAYLAGSVADPLTLNEEVSLLSYVNDAGKMSGISLVLITDNDGVIKASSNLDDLRKKVTEIYPMLPDKNGLISLNIGNIRHDLIMFMQPSIAKDRSKSVSVGRVYVGMDNNMINSRLNGFILKSALVAAAVLILSIAIISFFTHRITGPLNRLIEGTNVIAGGNLRHKIKVNVKNEFQVLANSLNEMTSKLSDYYDGILGAFTVAIDTKDKYTPAHARRVARLSVKLAERCSIPPRKTESIRIAALLKDIGNIGVERRILSKKEPLTPEEIMEIQRHPETSAKIIKNIEALKDVVPIILQHHERYDGFGYPAGLKGDGIGIEARILAIADAYDAMITEREHRQAYDREEAVYELRLNKGKQFDPELTEKFIEIILKEEVA